MFAYLLYLTGCRERDRSENLNPSNVKHWPLKIDLDLSTDSHSQQPHASQGEEVAKISQDLYCWVNWWNEISRGLMKISHWMQRSCGHRPWQGHGLQLQVSARKTKYCREVQSHFGMHHHRIGPEALHWTGNRQRFRAYLQAMRPFPNADM